MLYDFLMYNLPSYPTNRLETLIHLDKIARAMINQHDSKLESLTHQWVILPLGEIIHVGTMVMTAIKLITLAKNHHYTIVYDPSIDSSTETISFNSNHKLTTSFGHHIPVTSKSDTLPKWIDELCCMIQLYDTIKQLTILTSDQDFSQINPSSSVLWVSGNLHYNWELETTLVQDELILTKLIWWTIDDNTIAHYNILNQLTNYYRLQEQQYHIIPVSYHNTALLDGQKNNTSGYCVAMITKEAR
jgi:hypothetical protein